jgi:hypothetical protein
MGRHDVLDAVMSEHARVRRQQRGISADAVEVLLECGSEMHDHRGGTIVYMDKKARRRLSKRAGPQTALIAEQARGVYAVIGVDGEVVTVGHRYRRIHRS